MDQTALTMIENLHKNTGKSLDEWVEIVNKKNFRKHGEIIKFLKEEHGFTHGFANLVAHKSKSSDAGSADDPSDLISAQYKGKEHFKPIYDKLIEQVHGFGKDVEIAPKKSYVSLRRKKQFALLNPATKTRFEIGVNLKGEGEKGRLQSEKPNAMCSHKISVSNLEEVDKEVIHWMKMAYDQAG